MAQISKKVIEHKMCALIFSTTFVRNILIPRRTEQDKIKNVYIYFFHVKYMLFLSDFNES